MNHKTHIDTPGLRCQGSHKKVLILAGCLLFSLSLIFRSVFLFLPQKTITAVLSQNSQPHSMHKQCMTPVYVHGVKLNSGWSNGMAPALQLWSQGPSCGSACWSLMSWGQCACLYCRACVCCHTSENEQGVLKQKVGVAQHVSRSFYVGQWEKCNNPRLQTEKISVSFFSFFIFRNG